MVRLVKTFQKSMKGYRDDPFALDMAKELWNNGIAFSFDEMSRMYDTLSVKLTKGKVVWGTHEARYVCSRVDALAKKVMNCADGDACINLEELKLARDWKMIRSRVRPSWSELDKNDNDQVVRSTTEAYRRGPAPDAAFF